MMMTIVMLRRDGNEGTNDSNDGRGDAQVRAKGLDEFTRLGQHPEGMNGSL